MAGISLREKEEFFSLWRRETKKSLKDFPGGLVVKSLPPKPGGASLIPGGGAKIPHAKWPEKNKQGKPIKTEAIV